MEPTSKSTDPGASATPTADSERRRSVRIASRVNTQDTNESVQENTQNNSPTHPQHTTRPKIILHHNPHKSTNQDQGDPSQTAKNRDDNMADSTNERPRKSRRVRDDTSSRRARDQAGPSGGSGFEAGSRYSGDGSNYLSAADSAFGHGDRSGYAASPLVAGPSSSQQISSSGRGNSNKKAESSVSKGPRVPGMPSVMPRSDTPPPRFDTTNPYSTFSEQPAVPQRRPSATAGPSTIPTSLPSLPSDEALTGALQGSIQNQEAEVQGKLDYRDPNWRHPWGIPVEPLPPVPPRYEYIPPHEKAALAARMAAEQADDEGEEYHGLDEHIALGDHPMDIAFAQYLIDNQQQGDASVDYLNNQYSISGDLNEYDGFWGNSPAVSNEQPSVSGPEPAVSNAQLAVSSAQSAATYTQPAPQAGDTNVFPNYPYGFDQPGPNLTASTCVKKASVGNALMLLTEKAETLANQGADEEDIRRTSLAASIMGSLASEKAKADKTKAKGKESGHQQTGHNYQSQPDFKNLALGKVKVGKVSPTGQPTCTFCKYSADWGISDDRFRLPEEASTGWCNECGDPNAGSFFEEFTTILQSRTDQASKDALEKVMNEPVHSEPASHHHGKKVYSAIDGTEITKFMGPMFCKTCPWGQIDVEKVRICEVHRDEKFAIIKHHRHQEFRQIGYAMPEDVFSADKARHMNMNEAEDRIRDDVVKQHELGAKYKANRCCMMCTSYATDACANCPLRLCATCVTFLKNICKGYLDNLFYHYERHHLRNDAFLLRSDGGGF